MATVIMPQLNPEVLAEGRHSAEDSDTEKVRRGDVDHCGADGSPRQK
jgi:hypothetical protein